MIFEKYESKVRSYSRCFPAVFSKAKDEYLIDKSGKRYIDFLAGAGSLNYGHNNPYLKDKLISYLQDDNICHSLDLFTEAKYNFLDSFNTHILQPRNMSYVVQFTGPTGTNAVEAALKLARKVTGRNNIISFTNGFHGVTLGSLSVAGSDFYRNAAGVPTNNVSFFPYDGFLRSGENTIDLLSNMLSNRSSGIDMPAAVIVETIQGEGVNAASYQWLQDLQRVCHLHGILLIVDDIQSGCGRSANFFSFELSGISPDMITLSKSLSGSGLPMAVVLIKPELDHWTPGEHNGTFRGNNPAFVTATAAIEHYWRDKSFSEEVMQKSQTLKYRIEKITRQLGGGYEYKGRGFMQGLKCPTGKIAASASKTAFNNGLIIETCGTDNNVLKFLMPLTISIESMSEGLDILTHSLNSACKPTREVDMDAVV